MENGKEKPLEQDIKGIDSCGYGRTGCIGRHECAEIIPQGMIEEKLPRNGAASVFKKEESEISCGNNGSFI